MTDLAHPGSLRDELLEHIHWTYGETPVAERLRSHWVMDPEWLNDVRRIDERPGGVFHPMPPIGQPVLLLGLPLELRKGAGPPHLET